MSISYDLSSKENSNKKDTIRFLPILNPTIDKNPFLLETRIYPVEYDYPIKIQKVYTYQLPNDYSILAIPENKVVVLPHNDAKFIYNITSIGKTVFVSYTFVINRIQFTQESYSSLKTFYDIIVEKQNEEIVLTKK